MKSDLLTNCLNFDLMVIVITQLSSFHDFHHLNLF